jgi:AbrB family looped-hinge helix DNA binding protein
MALAKVTAKGQVTIPAAVRKSLDIKEGDDLLFEVSEGGEARIRVVKRRSLMDLYGALPATRPYPGREAVRAELGKSLGKRRAERKP